MKRLGTYVGRPTRETIMESILVEKADRFPTTVQFDDNDEKQELLDELDLLEEYLDEHNVRYLHHAFNFDQLNDEFPSFVEHVVVYVVAEGYDTNEEKWANTTYKALKEAWDEGDLSQLFTLEICYGYINYIRKCLGKGNPIEGFNQYTQYVTPTKEKKTDITNRNLGSRDLDDLIDSDDKNYERLADGIEDGMFTLNDLDADEYDKVIKILDARAKEAKKASKRESLSEGTVADYDVRDFADLAADFDEQIKEFKLGDTIMAAMVIYHYYEMTQKDKDQWHEFDNKQSYWQELAAEFRKLGYETVPFIISGKKG